jgi:hypothetical protein
MWFTPVHVTCRMNDKPCRVDTRRVQILKVETKTLGQLYPSKDCYAPV